MLHRPSRLRWVLLGLSLLIATPLIADERSADRSDLVEQHRRMVSKAMQFLSTKGQADDGSFSSSTGPAITALVATSLMKHGRSPDHPTVARALKYVEKFIKKDGGIYQKGSLYRNYETCLSVVCLKQANRRGRYARQIKQADAFIKGLQWDESQGKDPSDFSYGGAGYGKHKRADLSNTAFMIEALRAAGNDENSDAIQAALKFVSRTQNLESEHNTTPFSAKNPDGGFYYTPDAGGFSQAGTLENGGLRSYGSMTYAGLKSMIYAGVSPDDKRVKAAVKWIGKNYALDANPGMGQSGLFYYYHTFAKALDALQQDEVVDAEGVRHDWRRELIETLAKKQKPDGSFINDQSRWLEGDPNLVTAYALLTLAYARPTTEKSQ